MLIFLSKIIPPRNIHNLYNLLVIVNQKAQPGIEGDVIDKESVCINEESGI